MRERQPTWKPSDTMTPIVSRRSLTPPTGRASVGVHATRRTGGARRESTQRVVLRLGDKELAGWTLNISRGGTRVVLEDAVELGQEFDIVMGTEGAPDCVNRRGRIVWVQE